MRAFILIVVIMALGGGAYWLWGPSADTDQTQNQDTVVEPNPATTTTENEEADEPAGTDMTTITTTAELEAMFTRGENIRCKYRSNVEGTDHSGTIYYDFASNAYRIENTSVIEGDSYETDIIMRDQTLYTWGTSLMGEMAYEMSLPENSGPAEMLEGNFEMPNVADDTAPVDQSVVYECVETTVDPALFELPDGVEFMSMSDMMPAGSM